MRTICFLERAGCAGGGKGILCSEEKTFTLSTVDNMRVCMEEKVSVIEMGALVRGQGNRVWNDCAPTLRAEMGDNQPCVMHNTVVRRLTPIECERLQGFPDNYTNIPWSGKPTAPDSRRYKALGNSFAVPVVHWISKRIEAAEPIECDERAIERALYVTPGDEEEQLSLF